MRQDIVILGVFVADTAYRAARQPHMGETLLGDSFALGPGGKGSNQAVAAARASGDAGGDAGGKVHFITRLGRDPFADMARATWSEAGVIPVVTEDPDSYTGAAYIFVETGSGDNAIIVSPGAAGNISAADVEAQSALIAGAAVFVTQLEQPMDAALRGLELARQGGARTILNPAPAGPVSDAMLSLCDIVTPNETEAEGITGVKVSTLADAGAAADRFLERGVGAAIITLGEKGALYRDRTTTFHIPALSAGPVLETTGAGDAFNGGLAVAIAKGLGPEDAVRFGCATAGISVTRAGTAPSMPSLTEIMALLDA